MLPSRFCLTLQAEEILKRNKLRTGVPPNIMARELFFASIELGPILDTINNIKLGGMMLEKSVWLGDIRLATELSIKNIYGEIGSDAAALKWALHVEKALLYQGALNH